MAQNITVNQSTNMPAQLSGWPTASSTSIISNTR